MARYHNPKITTNKNLSLVLDAANPKSYTGVTTSVTTTIEDPYADNVSLLLNGNGTNGITTFTDSSSYGHTVTPVGNAQISTAQNKFGGASMAFLGSGSDRATISDNVAFQYGTDDFTIEMWVYITSFGNGFTPIVKWNGSGTSSGTRFGITINSSVINTDTGYVATLNYTTVQSITNSLNTWYHIAFVRSGTSLYIFRNGTLHRQAAISSSQSFTASGNVTLGSYPDAYTTGNGYIDDLRITKGVARYTSNFTPPTAELSLSTTETYQAPVLTDISLNNNTATLYNGVGYTSSNLGYFTFDGTNDYMEIPYDESVNLTDGDFTIDFWMNSFADQTRDVLVSYGNTSNVGGWAIKTATNKLQYSVGFATHPAFAGGIVTSGLVLNLDAGNSNSYPGSGTTWTDLSGNGNNGTLVNGVGYTSSNGGALTFDGVNDGVSVPGTNLSLNQMTISSWNYSTNYNQNGFMFEKTTNGTVNTQYSLFYNATGNNAIYYRTFGLSSQDLFVDTTTAGVVNNQWNNIVATFDGSQKKIYVNGVLRATQNVTGTVTQNSTGLAYIGIYGNFGGYPFNGNIASTQLYNKALTASEIQRNYNALKGRYTSQPSPLDPLDTFGIAENADFSSGITTNTWNHYALVRSGNVYTPYVNAVPGNPSYDYSADLNKDLYFDNASIILNANGDNGSTNIIDSSKNNHTGIITAYNGAGISTAEYKFGGSSLYFDGTNDYIDCGISSDYSFGNDPFTIEFWMRVNTSFFHTSENTIFSTTRWYGQFNHLMYNGIALKATIGYYGNNPNGVPYVLFSLTAGTTSIGFLASDYVSRGAFFHDNWGHIAISCDGTNFKCFCNGVLASTINAYNQPYEGDHLIIGGNQISGGNNPNVNDFINAYIDDFIITKGVAKYTENFTPPNQASYYSDDPNYDNLSILLQGNGTNGSTNIIDSSPNNHTGIITAYNGAGISTAEYKFGGSSLYFDGTNDYIDCGASDAYSFGTGDFMIEFWHYIVAGNQTWYSSGKIFSTINLYNSPGISLSVYGNPSSALQFYWQYSVGNSSTSFNAGMFAPINEWYHVAWGRKNGASLFFVNGEKKLEFTQTYTQADYTNNTLALGKDLQSQSEYMGESYIDDFRVTKGVAKYTEDFIPPDRTKIQNNQASLKFGASGTDNNNPFNGALSNLKIYKDSLTQSEITQNYNAHKSRYGL
jgi:hypothetical protein